MRMLRIYRIIRVACASHRSHKHMKFIRETRKARGPICDGVGRDGEGKGGTHTKPKTLCDALAPSTENTGMKRTASKIINTKKPCEKRVEHLRRMFP